MRADRQFGQRLGAVIMRVDDGFVALIIGVDFAVAHVADQQILPAFFRPIGGQLLFGAGNHMFAVGQRILVRTEGELAARNRGLVLRLLGHRLHVTSGILAFSQLVYHRTGRSARSGDEHGAHAIRIDRRGLQRSERILVQIVGNGDLRVGSAQRIQLVAHALRQRRQIAGIDAHAAQFGSGHFNSCLHGLFNVVRVNQQCGVLAERGNLRFKRAALIIMHQREAVRGRADGIQAIHLRGQQIGRALESAHYRSTGSGNGGPLVRTAPAHIHARAILRGADHAGRGRRDRGIVIQNAQQQRFQQRALAERAFDLQNRRIREEHLTFAIALDRTGKMEILKPFDSFGAYYFAICKEFQIIIVKMEIFKRVKNTTLAGGHPIVAAKRQMTGENLEYALAIGGAVPQARVKHGVFVHVGHECR